MIVPRELFSILSWIFQTPESTFAAALSFVALIYIVENCMDFNNNGAANNPRPIPFWAAQIQFPGANAEENPVNSPKAAG